jgi:hypothetical protein
MHRKRKEGNTPLLNRSQNRKLTQRIAKKKEEKINPRTKSKTQH